MDAFTLLEVSVVIGLLTVVLGSIFSVVFSFERLFSSQMREHTIDEAGWRVCELISQELRSVEPTTLMPLTISGSSYVTYQKVTGYQAGGPTVGPVTTLRLNLVPGEIANGVDDNGDGRVDEGYLTLTEGSNPTLRLQGHLLRLSFDSTQSGLAFSADVGIADRAGSVRKKTFNQEISFRNSQ